MQAAVVAAVTAAASAAAVAREVAVPQERRAHDSEEAIAKKEAQVRALDEALAREKDKKKAEPCRGIGKKKPRRRPSGP